MDTTPNDFEALRRLLKLKRYETPPPGYFDRFPESVLRPLRQEASAPVPTWWQQLLGALELRPVFASSIAVGAVGLYLIGLNLGAGGAMPMGSLSPASGGLTTAASLSPLDPLPVEHHASVGGPRLGMSLAATAATSAPPPGLFSPGGPEVAGQRMGLIENVSFRTPDFR